MTTDSAARAASLAGESTPACLPAAPVGRSAPPSARGLPTQTGRWCAEEGAAAAGGQARVLTARLCKQMGWSEDLDGL